MNGRIRVSIVVPTCRRLPLLRRCLSTLLAQQGLPAASYEVIVVDDGREDAVRDAVQALAAAHALPALRYVRPADGRGPAVARNTGWRAARGEIVAFTDDDTIPELVWVAAGEAALRAHPDWSAASGTVDVPLPDPRRLPQDHELMTLGLASAEFVTANAFVRRAALERVGGFDERFRRAWREDSDLQFRLMDEVGPVGRASQAHVQHPVRAESWGVSLRQQRNTFFDALLYKKHPRRYRERIRAVPPWDYYLVVALSLAVVPLGWAGRPGAALAALVGAMLLVLGLAWRRLARTDRSARHLLEMLATSALIPFLSVYWRLRGAWHFRVLFL